MEPTRQQKDLLRQLLSVKDETQQASNDLSQDAVVAGAIVYALKRMEVEKAQEAGDLAARRVAASEPAYDIDHPLSTIQLILSVFFETHSGIAALAEMAQEDGMPEVTRRSLMMAFSVFAAEFDKIIKEDENG